MTSPVFTQDDFAKWNQTTSVFHLPKKLVGKSNVRELRADFIRAVGATKVKAVQALPRDKFRVEFKSSSWRHQCDINGVHFRGVTLTPFPAYDEVKSVFVDRAPLQMPDQYLFEALAPYGRVLSVQQLTVRGFPNIKSGTRMVSMSVQKSIPAEIKVAGFSLSFKYRGQPPTCYVCQEVGHTVKDCPKSRKNKTNASSNNINNNNNRNGTARNTNSNNKSLPSSTSSQAKSAHTSAASQKEQSDLRDVINTLKASLCKPLDLPSGKNSGSNKTPTNKISISKENFDLDIQPTSPPEQPSPSTWTKSFS